MFYNLDACISLLLKKQADQCLRCLTFVKPHFTLSGGKWTSSNFITKMIRHWRSSHCAVTHVWNKNSNIQGRSPNVAKVISHAIRNCFYRKAFALSGRKLKFAPSGSKFFLLREVPTMKRDAIE